MRGVSSSTRGRTHIPCFGSMGFLTAGLPGKSLISILDKLNDEMENFMGKQETIKD